MKTAKIGVLFLVSIMALAGVSAGYAFWSQDLTVDISITSGEVLVGLYDAGTDDPGPNYLDGGKLYPNDNEWNGLPVSEKGTADPYINDGDYSNGENEEGKNIASTNSANDGEILFTKQIGSQGETPVSYSFRDQITETIKNAYPWYKSGCTFWISNAASTTIPVKIWDINLDVGEQGDIPNDEWDPTLINYMVLDSWALREYYDGTWHVITDSSTENSNYPGDEETDNKMHSLEWYLTGFVLDIDDSEKPDDDYIECARGWIDLLQPAYQLDPCHTLEIDFDFHFIEDIIDESGAIISTMPQGNTATFTLTFRTGQWNEDPRV